MPAKAAVYIAVNSSGEIRLNAAGNWFVTSERLSRKSISATVDVLVEGAARSRALATAFWFRVSAKGANDAWVNCKTTSFVP